MPTTDPAKLRAKWKRHRERQRENGYERLRSARRRALGQTQQAIARWRAEHPSYPAEWRAKHPGYQQDENKARQAAARARRKGILVRLPCEICGDESRVEAHHAFGYESEVALAVWWLCKYHHARIHVALRA